MRSRIFSLLAIAFLLTACSKSSSDTTTSPPTGGSGGGSTPPGPMFAAVKAVLQANCAVSGCHTTPNPQNGINFNDEATILAQKDRIKFRAVDEAGTANQMPQPPRAPLSAADQKKITDWLAAGGGIAN